MSMCPTVSLTECLSLLGALVILKINKYSLVKDRPTYRPSDGTDVGVEVGKEDFECQGVVGHNSCTTYRLKPSNPPQHQTPIELPKGRHRADRAQPVDPTKCQNSWSYFKIKRLTRAISFNRASDGIPITSSVAQRKLISNS